jgi:4-diphosphocytidyl-2-C-methyl-D-erythritol kinase
MTSGEARSQDVTTMLRQLHPECCEVTTPAKLNLFLEVRGKRPDGYHELETLMVTVSLFDTLRFTLAKPGEISLTNRWSSSNGYKSRAASLPAGPDNLVMKAATLLRRETNVSQGVSIELTKRIPLEAGMAGGSSDAAATLIGLNRLWNSGLSLADLRELGARLGSDVPFFLAGTTAAVCRGRGEIVEPLLLKSSLHFVIVKPAAGLSTAQVFQNCQPAQPLQTSQELVRSLQTRQLALAGQQLLNQLGPPAERLCEDVSQLRQRFDRLPLYGHLMSGSGTSYFGLCRSRQQAQQLAARLRAQRVGQVFSVQSCP